MKKLACITIIVLSAASLIVAGLAHKTEHSRRDDPTGKYTAICSYRTYLSFISMSPGSGSDKACFVKIIDATGENYGEIPVPMIQLADIEWLPNGAAVPLVGEWDFTNKTCFYWSKDGDRQIHVKK